MEVFVKVSDLRDLSNKIDVHKKAVMKHRDDLRELFEALAETVKCFDGATEELEEAKYALDGAIEQLNEII